MRLPVAVDLHINQFAGASITEYDRGITNGMIEKVGDRLYVTQRPAIDILEYATDTVSDERGRGTYFWSYDSKLYFINNDTIYQNSYGTDIDTISAGVSRVYMMALDDLLIILDPENDDGWTLNSSGTLAQITDTTFPPEDTPAVGLAHGGAVLDGYLFVLGENGTIYNSDFEDATSWTGTSFTTAERDIDGGVYLGKHHDQLVVFGPKTIEFFYDAGNATGSPLNRRQDVFHNIGCIDGNSVWTEGDRLFFVGSEPSGAVSVYVLENFIPRKISTANLDAFIAQNRVSDGYAFVGSGFTSQGHSFYILSFFATITDLVPQISIVYDDLAQKWGVWDTTIGSQSKFPVMGWTQRTGVTPRIGEGIFSNGDRFTTQTSITPVDTAGASGGVLEADVVEQGVLTEASTDGDNVNLICRLGQYDLGTNEWKYETTLRVVGDRLSDGEVTVKWSDERTDTFNSGRAIDMTRDRRQTRLGRYRRRNYQIEASLSEPIRIEYLETEQ